MRIGATADEALPHRRLGIPNPAHCRNSKAMGLSTQATGRRYVEGCWKFPYLKIQKLLNFSFMFLIDVKSISNILKNLYGDLHHFPVHALDFQRLESSSTLQNL